MNMPLLIKDAIGWQVSHKIARCLRVVEETRDVKTFWFTLKDNEPLRFKPGQFLTITFSIDCREVVRCYSISSAPSQPYQFAITVKRVSGGRVSNWLHDTLEVGHEIAIIPPEGKFNCIDIEADQYLFLSGGSGITPSMSMVRWMLDTGSQKDVHFIHSARSPLDIIFQDELLNIDRQWPDFQLSLLCEHKCGERGWAGYQGRLSATFLEMVCPDYRQRTVFCCGPAPYMQTVRAILESLDFPMARYFEESFGGAPLPVPAEGATAAETHGLATGQSEITFAQSGKRGLGSPTVSLLDTAMANGVWISSACRTGICGSCKIRKLSGSVTMDGAMALSKAEYNEGFVLACCAYPQEDVALDV